MIKLQDQKLSSEAIKQLAHYQQQIDVEADYPSQVKKASLLWRPRNRTFDEIKETLSAMAPATKRCGYCEDARGDDIEHFFPKSLYPELTFAWCNYLLACSACNSVAKRNQFAVFDTDENEHDVTLKNGDEIMRPIAGNPLLINPRYEDPLALLEVELLHTFHFVPRTGISDKDKRRAEYTIEILQLNVRDELVAWRKKAFQAFVDWLYRYKTYREKQSPNIDRQRNRLYTKTHLGVWEEMKRFYKQRDTSNWQDILEEYEHIAEMTELFETMPEVLELGIS
jgi:uncharacterized protein (TIGR02646 family)